MRNEEGEGMEEGEASIRLILILAAHIKQAFMPQNYKYNIFFLNSKESLYICVLYFFNLRKSLDSFLCFFCFFFPLDDYLFFIEMKGCSHLFYFIFWVILQFCCKLADKKGRIRQRAVAPIFLHLNKVKI